jgi:hypothetical protein
VPHEVGVFNTQFVFQMGDQARDVLGVLRDDLSLSLQPVGSAEC